MAGKPWSLTANGVTLTARLTPKGGRDAIDGAEVLADGRAALRVRVRAVPAEGEANTALVRLIANTMGVHRVMSFWSRALLAGSSGS